MAILKLDNVPTQLFIGGEWVDAATDSLIEVTNPATGEVIARVADASPEDGRRAADAANAAQEAFAAMTAQQRSQILFKAHALLLESKDELAAIMTAEMGKPFAEAKGEIDYSAGYLQW
jgi:succinate-semialdehyde dehydrogenase/glutarate-semialdehyde dehydrogenase